MTAPPPAAPAGAPPPPAPDIKTTADAVVQSLLPVIEGWEKINAKETRDMLARLLGEKTAQGPLQGSWAIADELLARARQEWMSPNGDPYTPLIAACLVLQERPVPASPSPATPAPTQPAPPSTPNPAAPAPAQPASVGVAAAIGVGIVGIVGGAAAVGAIVGIGVVGAIVVGAIVGVGATVGGAFIEVRTQRRQR